MKASVILSAYKNAEALRKVLVGYRHQEQLPDTILIAEDGQEQAIRDLVQREREGFPCCLEHVSQEDRGFRKNRILNKAIARVPDGLLIFSDGDMVPRADFVAQHKRLWRPGIFLSGGSHINIPESFHQSGLTDDHIASQQIFEYDFLKQIAGFKAERLRLKARGVIARLLDYLSPRSAFIGCNSSVARRDVLRVCGFDESLGYGGEDLNLGIRLRNAGLRGVRARYSLVAVHLEHQRSYVDNGQQALNEENNMQVRRSGETLPRKSGLCR